MRQEETWGNLGRHLGRPYNVQARGIPGPRLGVVWAPLAPLFLLFHSFLSLSRKNMNTSLALAFSLFLLAIFDLLYQPIISTEISSDCSVVCDSSDYPSRIFF